MSSSTQEEDFIDQLSRILPWQRSLTLLERILIVFIVSTFLSTVGCILLCLIWPQSPLRRRYNSKNQLHKERYLFKGNIFELPSPYDESIVKTNEISDYNKQTKNAHLHSVGKSSPDSDSALSNVSSNYPLSRNEKNHRSQSVRSSLSSGGVQVPYTQINVELEIDIIKNLLNIHLTNGEHFFVHPVFGEHAEYFIRIQLLNNKLLKKFQNGWKKHPANLSLNTWNKQQEKITKNLLRTSNDTLTCDEYVQFQFNKSDLGQTSLRFLLFCTDRSGIQDLMFEGLIPLNETMIPKYQQIVEFQNLPQVTFGEVFLGISYLPTAERFTINIKKLYSFFKIEKENKSDVHLTATFFHHGRQFFHKKIPFGLNSSITDNEIEDTIIQNIPSNDIQSVYVHLEFNSSISSTSILLGEHTRYAFDWQQMLEHPRQTYLGWYQFLG